MNPYDPTEHKETLIERGILNPHNYIAVIGWSLLAYLLSYFTAQSIWYSIGWVFGLLPSSIEQIQAWWFIVCTVSAAFWQLFFFGTMGENGSLAFPGAVIAWMVLVL